MIRASCNLLDFIGCLCGVLLFFPDPITAFESHSTTASQQSLSPPSSQRFTRRRKALRRHPSTGGNLASKTYTCPTSSITSLFVDGNQLLVVENMIADKNAVGVATAATIATATVVASMLSWRKAQHIQDDLNSIIDENKKLKERNHHLEATLTANDKTKQKSNGDQNMGKKSDKRERVNNTSKKQPYETTQEEDLSVMRIGVIRSIYRLCVGTPRQGLLAPDARGRIELDKIGNTSTGATVSGLEEFSYIWVLFHFHLNTQSSKKERRFKSKIAPPALGGKKVGIYATRSPHRHNPIGITLCKLDRIQVHGPHEVTLHVSGLDLVDGTPVLDIKPYVPVYDSVNVNFGTKNPAPVSETATATATETYASPPQPQYMDLQLPPPRVPEWVGGGLATKRNVVVTENAKNELEEILQHDPKALEFYGPHCFADGDDSSDSTMDAMLRVIEQVLSIDVRSSHQTRKARTGRSQAERAVRIRNSFDVEPVSSVGEGTQKADAAGCIVEDLPEKKMCTQQLDNLLIYFSVQETKAKRETSEGSGAEDGITVESIQLLPHTEKKKRGKR